VRCEPAIFGIGITGLAHEARPFGAGVDAAEIAARQRRDSEREVARLAVLAAEKILTKHYD